MRLSVPEVLSGTPPEASWLVQDIFPTHQMIVLAGEAGVGKSFFCYSLALAVTGGLSFLGKQTRPGRALIYDEENGLPDLSSYLYDLWAGYGAPPIDGLGDRLRIEHFSMTGNAHDDATSMMLHAKEHAPDLIVIDTVGSVITPRDENDNAEAARQFRVLKHIKNQAPDSCTMIILKHARIDRKTGHKDIRGAKDWNGKADGVLFLGKTAGRPRHDGMKTTYLEPLKVRAFGLRKKVQIAPRIITPAGKALELFELAASA